MNRKRPGARVRASYPFGRPAPRALLWLLIAMPHPVSGQEAPGSFEALYQEHCAVCHGASLEGAAQGSPLAGIDLVHGSSVADLQASIANGFSDRGMPAWSRVLTAGQISSLAIFIAERRTGYGYDDFRIGSALTIPSDTIPGELHDLRLETVIDGLDPLPYSIAPLPDGSILLTEKMRGLSCVSPDGKQSALIAGAPRGHDDASGRGRTGLRYGNGWVLDVAIHPRYVENGWVYVSYGDRCEDCNAVSRETKRPVSMLKLVRGRIRDGAWADEQVLWQTDVDLYTPSTDMALGGRIAFDPEGYLFLSFGMKGGNNHRGVQDLSLPWGKIHRLHDDGRIPLDNPFIDLADAIKTVWTIGHRSPQGLEFDPRTRELWGTEMGPRGGDEVNRLLRGHNYGWPLYSKGVNYDGTPVAYGEVLGLEVGLADIDQPVVDLTPSPAVSSFVVYDGNAFPGWRGNLLVGTLKGADLRRMVVKDGRVVHVESLLEKLGRIRDVETGSAGEIYLLLEHADGGRIVRMIPAVSGA